MWWVVGYLRKCVNVRVAGFRGVWEIERNFSCRSIEFLREPVRGVDKGCRKRAKGGSLHIGCLLCRLEDVFS